MEGKQLDTSVRKLLQFGASVARLGKGRPALGAAFRVCHPFHQSIHTPKCPLAATPPSSCPQPQQFNRQALDLYKLFRLVLKAGGYQTVLDQKGWVSCWLLLLLAVVVVVVV